MDDPTAKPTSHLTRLCRYLLASGVIALAISTFVQWDTFERGGSLTTALTAQVLTVLGTVALTGAVFGYVLVALQRDRDGSATDERPDTDWWG